MWGLVKISLSTSGDLLVWSLWRSCIVNHTVEINAYSISVMSRRHFLKAVSWSSAFCKFSTSHQWCSLNCRYKYCAVCRDRGLLLYAHLFSVLGSAVISVMVSDHHKKKLLWWLLVVTLIYGCKDKYLEWNETLHCFGEGGSKFSFCLLLDVMISCFFITV